MNDVYFKVKIENPERKGHMPTYTVLGEAKVVYGYDSYEVDWELGDTLQLVREATYKPRCMIMLIADQQTPSIGTNHETNKLFGQHLTGAKRFVEGVVWTGDYRIEREGNDPSVAETLYEDYNHFTSVGTQESDAIIVDVLNPNNNWLYGKKRKDGVVFELSERVIKPILKTYEEIGYVKPALLFAGFGRGALLAYHLANQFANEVGKVVLVSIDPRVRDGATDEKQLIHKWGRRKHGKWTWVSKRPRWCGRNDYFPVLDAPDDRVKCYNVFQRHNFNKLNKRSAAWPVGCAIEGAESPENFDFSGFEPYDCPKPGNQGDNSIHQHSTKMLDRYGDWISRVAEYEGFIPKPELTGIDKAYGHATTLITLTGSSLDNSIVVVKDYEGSHEVSPEMIDDDGHTLKFKYPEGLVPGMKKICVRRINRDSNELDFMAAPCIAKLGEQVQMPGANVELNGHFVGGWRLHIEGAGIDEELSIEGNSQVGTDAAEFTVPTVGNYSRPVVGPVKLQAELGETGLLGDELDFVIAPYIKSIEPFSGVPGSDVTVTCHVVTQTNSSDITNQISVTNKIRFSSEHTPFALENGLTAGSCTVTAKVPDTMGGDCFVEIESTHMGQVYSNMSTFTVIAAITAFNPAVPEKDDTVEVMGLGFANNDKVMLNGLDVGATYIDHHTLSFTLLAGIGEKEIVVVSDDGRRTEQVTLGVAPFITSASSPASGLPSDEIQLKGYFKRADSSPSGGNQLSYRGTPISVWLANENTLVFTVPEVAAGDGELQVTSASGHTSNIINFAVEAKIKGLSKQAVRPGEVLTISGANFTDACRLRINGAEVTANYVSSDTFEWLVPDKAEPGPRSAVMVDTSTGLTGNEVDFGVTPYIKFLSTESEAPGATIVAHGFFCPDDHIQMEGKEASTEVNDELTLSFIMPPLRRGGSGEVIVVEGNRRSNGAHCEVNFVAWPTVETRRDEGQEYHWLSAMDSECYHRADCWRVEKMAREDLLGFASREDAWLFGFEPCNCVKEGGEQVPEKTLPAGYIADAAHLKHSFDFPYYGNVNSRELHQEPCVRQVADIPVASRIGFLDLDEAHALGFDNCHYCLGDSER